MIYFLKSLDNSFVKVGFTKYRDQTRIDQINCASPLECELILFLEGDMYFEKELHKKFERYLVAGKNEWFSFSTEISKYVENNKSESVIPIKRLEGVRRGNKTSPTGVRFDIEKLDFVQKREKLETNQKVVDFLLNKYWWEYKVAVPTYKESPPLHLRNQTVQKSAIVPIDDEPLSFDKLRQQIAVPAATNDFFGEMNRAESLEELEAIGRRIKASGMTWKEQQRYHEYGKQIANKKFN